MDKDTKDKSKEKEKPKDKKEGEEEEEGVDEVKEAAQPVKEEKIFIMKKGDYYA